ncbi:MAG: imidazole glycerol phosphate synthase subunit HisF [Bdellovibrio sp.]|nr:imidazole glycerol phosphate synthase subunit HisF [Bdellovibrio sp.]
MEKRYIRLIPRLDIKGPNLVKGIQLEGLRVLGQPDIFAKEYYEAGACELFYMDVVASLFERNSLTSMVSNIARDIFAPITVGGGLRNLDDIKKVLDSGADKVALNTAAIRNPKLISEAANKFGSSTIVVCIEAIKQPDGRYLAFVDNGREHTGVEVFEWTKKVADLGAGEIVITSVDREGSGAGFDIELINQVSNLVSVPVVAHGGAGSVDDIIRVIRETKVNGIAVASIFHYYLLDKINTFGTSKDEGNTRFLSEKRTFSKIKPISFASLLEELKKHNVVCRSI